MKASLEHKIIFETLDLMWQYQRDKQFETWDYITTG